MRRSILIFRTLALALGAALLVSGGLVPRTPTPTSARAADVDEAPLTPSSHVLTGRIVERQDDEPLAFRRVDLVVKVFHIQCGMGARTPYVRVGSRTDADGAFRLVLPAPEFGTLSSAELTVSSSAAGLEPIPPPPPGDLWRRPRPFDFGAPTPDPASIRFEWPVRGAAATGTETGHWLESRQSTGHLLTWRLSPLDPGTAVAP